MLEKMYFFMPDGQYGATRYFTEQLCQSLKKKDVECQIFDFEEDDVFTVMERVKRDRPDCTCTFNPILPLPDGRLFCDHIETPHLNCLVDSSIEALYLLKSPYSIISCVDLFLCEYLQSGDFQNVFFFPHGVDADLQEGTEGKRRYDISMLGTCVDYEEIHDMWLEKYPPKILSIIEDVIKKVFSDDRTPYLQTLLRALSDAKISPKEIVLTSLVREVERYIKGKGRLDMIRAIKDAEVHVFGKELGSRGWEDYLSDQKNVIIHDSISFEEGIKVMGESKVVLNSMPFFKYGSHERLFYGLASGAVVLSDETLYTKEIFKEREGVIFYRSWDAGNINEEINKILSDKKERSHLASVGRKRVINEHSWDQRASLLIEKLPKFLANIKNCVGVQ